MMKAWINNIDISCMHVFILSSPMLPMWDSFETATWVDLLYLTETLPNNYFSGSTLYNPHLSHLIHLFCAYWHSPWMLSYLWGYNCHHLCNIDPRVSRFPRQLQIFIPNCASIGSRCIAGTAIGAIYTAFARQKERFPYAVKSVLELINGSQNLTFYPFSIWFLISM